MKLQTCVLVVVMLVFFGCGSSSEPEQKANNSGGGQLVVEEPRTVTLDEPKGESESSKNWFSSSKPDAASVQKDPVADYIEARKMFNGALKETVDRVQGGPQQ